DNIPHEAYDEGRVTERIMIAATMLGLGAGTAWFGEPEREAVAKELLNVPAANTLRSVVAIGPFEISKDPRAAGQKPGRKSLDGLVNYDTNKRPKDGLHMAHIMVGEDEQYLARLIASTPQNEGDTT